MSLRAQLEEIVIDGRVTELDALVASEPRALRHLVAMTYRPEAEIRQTAILAVGRAGHHHPELIQKIIRRLVWAMNDESGTNAITAPAVLQAIASECPELLLPMVPDLTRLSADAGLGEGLAATLHTVARRCPGQVARELQESLNDRFRKGASNGDRRRP